MFKELVLIFSLMGVASCSQENSPANSQLLNDKNTKDLAPFFPEDLTLNFLNEEGSESSPLTAEDLSLVDRDLLAIKKGGDYTFTGMRGETSECLGKAKNWRVTSIRFAPSQIPFPGQSSIWKKWAESQGKRVDLIPEIRYVLRPFCQVIDTRTDLPATLATDHALHLIFRPTPESGIDRGIVLATEFNERSLRKDFAFTDRLASENIEQLSSPAWIDFRKTVISDWNQISKARALDIRKVDSLSSLYKSLFNFAKGFMLGSAVSQDLKQGGNLELNAAIAGITAKYAKRNNISALTSMSHSVARIWVFAAFKLNRSMELTPEKMLTFRAKQEASHVRVSTIAEQVQHLPASRVGSVTMMPGVEKIFFEQQEGGPEDVLASGPAAFPKFKQLVTNTSETNPSTMTCESCHKLAAEYDDNGEIPAVQENFIMTEAGAITILTAVETTEDAKKLNQEFGLVP